MQMFWLNGIILVSKCIICYVFYVCMYSSVLLNIDRKAKENINNFVYFIALIIWPVYKRQLQCLAYDTDHSQGKKK